MYKQLSKCLAKEGIQKILIESESESYFSSWSGKRGLLQEVGNVLRENLSRVHFDSSGFAQGPEQSS